MKSLKNVLVWLAAARAGCLLQSFCADLWCLQFRCALRADRKMLTCRKFLERKTTRCAI